MNNNFCYIHIPFCTSKCKYCRFASFGFSDQININLYIEHLIDEIKNNKMDFSDLRSIYFGGGTPSILKVEQLENIIKTLDIRYGLVDDIEITLEVTPITITKDNLKGWKKIGINRLSIGVQTLNNDTLVEIGREEKGNIISALDNIKEIGFNNVSIDFIIGLPFVKVGDVKKDIEYILKGYNYIKHICVYMLEEYYDLPESIDSKFDNIIYPNSWNSLGIRQEEYLGEYIEVKEFLRKKGFNSYEISNFAKAGFECKHNKAYWNHSNILAFGLGAHGFIKNNRYANSEEFLKYYSGIKDYEEKLDKDSLFIEKIMFSLRTDGININQLEKLNTKKITEFINDGYLKKGNSRILLTNKGVLVLDYILKEII